MPKKKKYVLAHGYIFVVAFGLLTIYLLLLAPYARWPLPKGLAVVVMAWILFTCGRHYVFSETGIKAYLLGIRIRNVPWSDVGRLILFHNETAKQKKNYEVYPASFIGQSIRNEEFSHINLFLVQSRALFHKYNKGIEEYIFR